MKGRGGGGAHRKIQDFSPRPKSAVLKCSVVRYTEVQDVEDMEDVER